MIKSKKLQSFLITILAGSLLLNGCQANTNVTPTNTSTEINYPSNPHLSMLLTSPSFTNNALMPAKFSCQGAGVNPQLEISGVGSDIKSLALILDDPDAPSGDFVHWVMWNIPATTKNIPENVGPKFAVQGNNGAGKPGYYAPCPPTGIHRYFFRLYALSENLNIPATSTKADLLKAMDGKILDEIQLMGTYRKS